MQAWGLKKNRDGRSPVSKISDSEESTASLGDSEPLSVQHSPGEAIPCVDKRSENVSDVLASCRCERTGDVFPNDPASAHAASKSEKLEGQDTTRIIQSRSVSADAE